MRRLELNPWQPETANPRGAITFGAGRAYNRAADTQKRGAGNSYAAALLGLVSNYSKSLQFFDMKTREWQFAWYIRDRWQVSRRLPINAGLRYEYYPLINRGDRGIERWDPATNIVYFGGLGGTPRDAGIQVSKKLFGPRIGLAYRVNDNFVVRAGYSLIPDPLGFGPPLPGLHPATPTGVWNSPISTYGWDNTLGQGLPEIPTPHVSQCQALLPARLD